MQTIPSYRQQRDIRVGFQRVCLRSHLTKNYVENGVHDDKLQKKDNERGEVKPEQGIASAERIIQSQRSKDKRAISAVCRKDAEGGCIPKEARHISQAAYVWVIYDGVGIVKVELIVKAIGVNSGYRQQYGSKQQNWS